MKRILPTAFLFLASSALAHAETSAEYAKLGQKIWPAYICAIAAEKMNDKEAHARLFKLAYDSGKTFLEAFIAGKIDKKDIQSRVAVAVTFRMQGPSIDFILGRIFEGAAEDYSDKIYDSCPLCLTDDDLAKMHATTDFRKMNCELLE